MGRSMEQSDQRALRKYQPLAGLQALVADDDPAARALMISALKRTDALVTEAADGDQALQLIQQAKQQRKSYRLLLLDLLMPGTNGVAVLAAVRKDPELSGMRIVVFSAVEDERVRSQCAQIGISAYLVKPQTVESILDAALEAITGGLKVAVDEQGRVVERADGEHRSSLGFPLEFQGLPDRRSYALRRTYYRCPFCETTFAAPRLIDRAMKRDPADVYGVGLYHEPFEREFIEYLLLQTIVCPSCCYGSDRSGFHMNTRVGSQPLEEVQALPTSQWPGVFFAIWPPLIASMEQDRDARLAILRRASDRGQAMFRLDAGAPNLPRAHEDALIGLELTLHGYRVLAGHFEEEHLAQVQAKMATTLFRRAAVLQRLAGSPAGMARASELEAERLATLEETFGLLMSINEVEFRDLTDRLNCMTRRFRLADELINHACDEEHRERCYQARRRVLGDMRMLRLAQINDKTGEERRVQHYLDPIESRMHEIGKLEKEQGGQAA